MYYNDKFDADQRADLEEKIETIILNETALPEHLARVLRQEILYLVVSELRPDLVAKKWKISDGTQQRFMRIGAS